MFKKILLMCLLVPFPFLFSSCKWFENPAGPDEPLESDFGKIEFMYVRVKEIVYPVYPDPTGDAANIYPGATRNTSPFEQIRENAWVCYAELEYSNGFYWFWLRDKKISWTQTIAEDVYARRYGTNEPWLKLICIEDLVVNPSGGKCVKFLWNKQGVQNPCN
jgi:hypothetical protein